MYHGVELTRRCSDTAHGRIGGLILLLLLLQHLILFRLLLSLLLLCGQLLLSAEISVLRRLLLLFISTRFSKRVVRGRGLGLVHNLLDAHLLFE